MEIYDQQMEENRRKYKNYGTNQDDPFMSFTKEKKRLRQVISCQVSRLVA